MPKLTRTRTPRNVLDAKHQTYPFNPPLKNVLGQPQVGGMWLIYGKEKHGKTWGALMLARHFSNLPKTKVLYVSAEQGLDLNFSQAIHRAGINPHTTNLGILPYEDVTTLLFRLKQRKAPNIVFIDNLTIYADELPRQLIRDLQNRLPNTLFVFIAHQERGEPYTAAAKLIAKLAAIIIKVEGLKMLISGRCPGGELHIDQNKSLLFHGQQQQ